MDDIKPTTITNITPQQIQVLDPDTYDTVELEKKDMLNSLNIGEEVNVLKVNNRLYIVLKD